MKQLCFLARLDEVQEELLYYPRHRHWHWRRGWWRRGVSKKFSLKVFYVMGKALSGELSCPCDKSCLILASFLSWDQLLKVRICSHRSKFLLLRVDSILEVLYCPRTQTESYKSCSPLKKLIEKYGGVSRHLKY